MSAQKYSCSTFWTCPDVTSTVSYLVPEFSIAIAIKDTNPPPGPSFLFYHMKKFNDEAHYGSLSNKWGITAFMDRKTPGGDDVMMMRYLSGGSTYP